MNRNSATLRLTEPVIFLRCGTDSASRRGRGESIESPPALLRAILTLKLVKPTRVTIIDVTFEGVSKTDWPDGELASLSATQLVMTSFSRWHSCKAYGNSRGKYVPVFQDSSLSSRSAETFENGRPRLIYG